MSDIALTTDAPQRAPRPRARQDIQLPDGEVLTPRTNFAAILGVSERTVARMNLPTTYVGNVAYVARDASLKIVAERVRRRNEPARRKRHHR
jgi:hypothetical protein